MAFAGDRFFMSCSFIDAGNNTTRTRLQLDVATMADALTAAAAVAPDLAACSKAYMVGYTVEREFLNGDVRTPAGEVEEKALITLALSGVGSRKAAYTIPAPVDTLFAGAAGTDAYNVIDPGDATLTAFTDHFNTGNELFISDGEHTTEVIKGKRIHRSSSRG